MRRRAFTLVELLVVIGIIAVLIAILMPVLNRARESANQVKCLSNLRQLGMAIIAYTNENKGFYPSSATKHRQEDWIWWESTRNPNNMNYAMGSVIPYLGGQQVPSLGGIAVAAGVLRCPSDDVTNRPAQDSSIGPYLYSYTVNGEICRSDFSQLVTHLQDSFNSSGNIQYRGGPVRSSQVIAPSRKILAIDEASTTIDDGDWQADNYTNNQMSGKNCLSNRHDPHPAPVTDSENTTDGGVNKFQANPGRGNVVYCDGHGEFIPRVEAYDKYHYEPYLNPDADPTLK